jgi:hypothetical protein
MTNRTVIQQRNSGFSAAECSVALWGGSSSEQIVNLERPGIRGAQAHRLVQGPLGRSVKGEGAGGAPGQPEIERLDLKARPAGSPAAEAVERHAQAW